MYSKPTYVNSESHLSRSHDIMSRGRPVSTSSPRRTSYQSHSNPILSPISDDFPTPRASDFPSIPAQPKTTMASAKPSLKLQTEYDDLYDISEDESEQRDVVPELQFEGIVASKSSYSPSPRSSPQIRNSWSSSGSGGRKSLSLQVPSSQRKQSPVVPAPSSKISMLPSLLSFLAQDVPSSTAPPSLDGSLTSDQLATMESPPTPSTSVSGQEGQQWGHQGRSPYTGSVSNENEPWQGVIQLDPEALATLQIFSDESEEIAPAEPSPEPREMSQVIELPRRSKGKTTEPPTPATPYSLADLDIPSPTLFFSSLAPTSRNAWCQPSENVPTSATAEHFYIPSITERQINTLEQPKESRPASVDVTVEDEKPKPIERSASPSKSEADVVELPEVTEYDTNYERNLAAGAALNFDRTSLWLQQQEDFGDHLKDSVEPPTISAISTPVIPSESPSPEKLQKELPPPPPAKITLEQVKKAARISTSPSVLNEKGEPVQAEKKDPLLVRAYQHALHTSTKGDVFTNGRHRIETIQTRRLCSQQVHRDRLEGSYSTLSKKISEDSTDEAKLMLKVEKERHALQQVDEAVWNISGIKTLNGGSLLSRPASKRVARYTSLGADQSRGRILDLGGQPVCDWGWACATEYPNMKVYTVVEKAARHPSAAGLRGPSNHRVVSVPTLWRLPFADNYFDVISTRSLHSLLRGDIPYGEWDDEYELCLKECMRCLKPGGYLEFSIMDADMMRAGPLGSTLSVEFAYNLKSRGYDPYASRVFLGRLTKAGFNSINRSWMFLPAGPAPVTETMRQKSILFQGKPTVGDKAAVASTTDVAAVTGLVGGLAWEKWMWKLQTEMAKTDSCFFTRVRSVLEEGARSGAGWRTLNGYARKPTH